MGQSSLLLWAIVLALGALFGIQLVVARLRSGGRRRHDEAVAAACRQRGMLGVDNARRLMVPQMIPINRPVFNNTFATADWTSWFSEVRDADDGSALISNAKGPFAVLMFLAPGLNLPYVAVARKVQLEVGGGTPGQPVELESIQFTDRFRVRSVDPRAAVMLLDLAMMQFLLDCDRVSFQISGPVVYAVIKRTDVNSRQAEDLELLFRFQDAFAAHVPNLVRSEFIAPAGYAEAVAGAMLQLSTGLPTANM